MTTPVYYLAKTLVQPYLLLIVIGTVTAWRLRRRTNLGAAKFVHRILLVLWILSLPSVGWLIRGSLERQFRPPGGRIQIPEQLDVIIVLGGGINIGDAPQDAEPSLASMTRCLHAIKLGEGNSSQFILCGGTPRLTPEAPSESEVMRDFMVTMGVAPERIITEQRSSNSWENARFSAEICREKGFESVAVVTQGWHLRRVLGCFRRVGLDVTPNGCDWQPDQLKMDWYRHALPSVEVMNQNQQMIQEWLGIAWYRYHDRIE